eukprot:Amastigsp_a186147_11.p2 type:complete len:131 gc:universal Amastigsp_a186147_11:2-394(+)
MHVRARRHDKDGTRIWNVEERADCGADCFHPLIEGRARERRRDKSRKHGRFAEVSLLGACCERLDEPSCAGGNEEGSNHPQASLSLRGLLRYKSRTQLADIGVACGKRLGRNMKKQRDKRSQLAQCHFLR